MKMKLPFLPRFFSIKSISTAVLLFCVAHTMSGSQTRRLMSVLAVRGQISSMVQRSPLERLTVVHENMKAEESARKNRKELVAERANLMSYAQQLHIENILLRETAGTMLNDIKNLCQKNNFLHEKIKSMSDENK